MDTLVHDLGIGFAHVFVAWNLLMLTIGLLIGMAVSIMPGLGLVMGIVLTLPFTYSMDIESAIILLTAIYIAGTYGGCFTAILYKIPGEPSDVPLLWDGYRMNLKGEAAKALGWALVAALIGGLVSSGVMVSLAGPFAKFALTFDSPDYFAIIVLGLATVVCLATSSLAHAFISLFFGLIIATIGIDSTYGAERFTFGQPLLSGGINYITVLVGAYGLGEVFTRFGRTLKIDATDEKSNRVRTRFPTWREIWALRQTISRSTVIGTVLGVVPGAGAVITSFVSYGIERQYCKRRKDLGSGIPEGIVAPQIASTASVAGHMVPLLALGIPGSGATAVILGAFLLHGVQPGPQIFVTHPDTAYAILASLFVGVVGMCVIGFFWIRLVVKVLTIPQPIIIAIVVLFCIVGAYAERNNIADVGMILVFGVVGYLFDRYGFPIAPMVLGTILGPLAESSFLRSMIRYENDWTIFFRRPMSCTMLVLAIIAFAFPLVSRISQRRYPTVAAPTA
ncbi:MAG TPA: tripartite tricarboxylate transporter permease [Casimicrobiaceae bacterium]|nr:tripartite tricarboxylate transporter permease [Casimicrobiaceae bacterium]